MVEQEIQEEQKSQENSSIDLGQVASALREATEQIRSLKLEVDNLKNKQPMPKPVVKGEKVADVGQKQRKVFEKNEIPVGNAPIGRYLRAVSSAFVEGKFKEVSIMGRGRYISRAVDVALVTVERNIKYAYIDNIKAESVVMNSDKTKEPVNISSIIIRLKVQE